MNIVVNQLIERYLENGKIVFGSRRYMMEFEKEMFNRGIPFHISVSKNNEVIFTKKLI